MNEREITMKRRCTDEEDGAEGGEDGEEDEEEEEEDEDEDGNRLIICQHTLEDELAGYGFEIELRRHYEFKSVVEISVSITYEKHAVGRLKGLVIDRNFRPRWQFHELCDAESQELQEMSVCFCNDDGSLRYKDLDGLTEEQDGAASQGGFLQIELVSISEAHRRKDLGVRCVKKLLEWLNTRDARQCQEHDEASRLPRGDMDGLMGWLAPRKPLNTCVRAGWTLAVLQPGLENTPEDHACLREEHRREIEGEEPSAADQAREAERMAQQKAARRKVAQQWARLGFRQAKFASEFWYVTPSRLGLLSKEEVSGLLITETPERQPVAELDAPLISYLREAKDVPLADFEADVRRLVASGASLNRCHVLIHDDR